MIDSIHGMSERELDQNNLLGFYMRKVCFYSIAPHRDKNSPIKSEKDLWPHPYDSSFEKQRLTNIPKAEITFSDDE